MGKTDISARDMRGVPRRSQLPSLDAIAYSSMGLLVLLIGSWVPDDRLNVYGLPLDIVVMGTAVLVATTAKIRLATLKSVALIQLPLVLIGITIFWSTDPAVGLNKLTTLVVSGSIGFVLLNTVIEKHGVDELARLIALYLALLLLAAIPYKLAFGFFDRTVSFFINGPIVFGRLMCVGAIMALFFLRGKRRVITVAVFFVAVVWTESKGPILALIVTLISVGLIGARPEVRRNVLILLATTVAALFLATAVFDLDANSFGRLGVFYTLATADTTAIQGTLSQSSFGARIEMWSKTIELIPNAPFGIGLGAWDRVVDTRLPTPYPHNLFLELWSEGGIILGSFAAIPFLMFLFAPRKIFWFVAFCLFLAQMISGDIADARFLMVFGFLAFFSRREPDAIGEEVLQPEIFDSALQPRAAN